MIERFMLNEELEERVCEITSVDYTGMLTVEDITNIIKDLIVEYDRVKEEFDDYKEQQDQEPFNPYDEFDINPKDFV